MGLSTCTHLSHAQNRQLAKHRTMLAASTQKGTLRQGKGYDPPPTPKTHQDDRRCIQSGNVVIDSVIHRVAARFVVCNPALNHRAWSVTEPVSACPICFPVTFGQLSLFLA